jgi:hypothetical protein
VDADGGAGVSTPRAGGGPGLRDVLLVWGIWGVVAAMVFVTYARLPSSDFYNVTGSGVTGGAARVLVLIGWPISLAVVALLALATDRLLAAPLSPRERRAVVAAAVASAALCATIAWPGVIKQSDLDAKASNGLAAAGVGLAAALTALAVRRCGLGPRGVRGRGDWVALGVAAAFALAALPWIFANAGVYVGDVPGLKAIFMSKKILPEPGHPNLHAVHLGNHEGLDGWLLAVTALLLRPLVRQMRPTRLRPLVGAYLALLLGYGIMVAANDGWNEQIVKRGWASRGLPNVITPGISWGWAVLAVAAALVFAAAYRVRPAPSTAS